MSSITFFVPGIPKPGGSKRFVGLNAGGRAILVDACKKNKDWRAVVAWYARKAHAGPPLSGPLAVSVTFVMPRPKSHFCTGRNAGALKPNATSLCVTRPDATKLWRAAEDALTGILWMDDAQICDQRVTKMYDYQPGMSILVTTIQDDAMRGTLIKTMRDAYAGAPLSPHHD